MTSRKLLRAVVVIAAVLVGIVIAPGFCPRMDLYTARDPTPAIPFGQSLPIFAYPRVDDERDSGVKAVFVAPGNRAGVASAEITVVFGDEDHPWFLIDRAYKLFRWVRWKRLMDVETFHYLAAPGTTTAVPAQIELPGEFADEQRWDVFIALHYSKTLPIGDFESEGKRPVVHINTWNHLFGPRTTNADRPAVRVTGYPVSLESRAGLEARFAKLYSGVWWRPFAALAACVAIGALVPLPRRR